METLEKQQLERAIALLMANRDLADFGEKLPGEIRQLGIAHTLMKHSKERTLTKALLDEISYFDATLFAATDNLLSKVRRLNNLPFRTSSMLHEHLFSFAEEFRKVAKVLSPESETTRV